MKISYNKKKLQSLLLNILLVSPVNLFSQSSKITIKLYKRKNISLIIQKANEAISFLKQAKVSIVYFNLWIRKAKKECIKVICERVNFLYFDKQYPNEYFFYSKEKSAIAICQ